MELERIETQHNTPEQAAEYLNQAQAIADEHGIDREREPEVFCKLLDLVSTKQITTVQRPTAALLGIPGQGLQ